MISLGEVRLRWIHDLLGNWIISVINTRRSVGKQASSSNEAFFFYLDFHLLTWQFSLLQNSIYVYAYEVVPDISLIAIFPWVIFLCISKTVNFVSRDQWSLNEWALCIDSKPKNRGLQKIKLGYTWTLKLAEFCQVSVYLTRIYYLFKRKNCNVR